MFKHANADLVITVQRMAVPAILKSIFTRNKVFVVFHHYDKREKRSFLYHLNAWVLLKILSAAPSHVRVIVVAGFWKDFLLTKGIPAGVIMYFPNLFDTRLYEKYRSIEKNDRQIYLGQYSAKQHTSVPALIEKLTAGNYYCFYTTPYKTEKRMEKGAEILHLDFDEYLKKVASSSYTVCLGAFDEGWNRIAHESLLCNTAVIGNESGGLTDLISQSGQFLVTDSDKAYETIIHDQRREINSAFLRQYDLSQISYYAKPIIDFCIS